MDKLLQNESWVKHWAGSFNFLYDTLLGFHNTKLLKDIIGTDLNPALYIYKEGYTSAYFQEEDYKKFGEKIGKMVVDNPLLVKEWCKCIIKATDKNVAFAKEKIGKELDYSDYQKFVELFNEYSTWHRPIKVVVDFLPHDLLEQLLPELSKARLHAEPAYEYHEKLIRSFSKKISEKSVYFYNNLLALSRDEVNEYFKTKELPNERILAERYRGSAVLYFKGECKIIVGNEVKKIEDHVSSIRKIKNDIKGSVAFSGKVVGTVRIVFDPLNAVNFNDGDILATGMTRPEYLSLMKKASAFITDAGGILSHAAIVAREFKKPCIIGTQIATRILKDGDLVEVDAEKGIVKILKRVEEK